jgi:hypothetical protein
MHEHQLVFAPSPFGGGLGWGHDEAPPIHKRQVTQAASRTLF